MKQVLIIKTASESVMQQLLQEVACMEATVCCMVQSSALGVYQNKYPDVKVLDIGGEGFSEQTVENLDMKQILFDEIVVPSSTPYFRNYDNVFFMVDKLNYKKLVLYDCYGNKKILSRKNRVGQAIEYLFAKSWMWLCTIAYQAKSKIQGD